MRNNGNYKIEGPKNGKISLQPIRMMKIMPVEKLDFLQTKGKA